MENRNTTSAPISAHVQESSSEERASLDLALRHATIAGIAMTPPALLSCAVILASEKLDVQACALYLLGMVCIGVAFASYSRRVGMAREEYCLTLKQASRTDHPDSEVAGARP